MKYCQTINEEAIVVHPMDDLNDSQFINLIKYGNEPMFSVRVDDGEDEWVWDFDMSNPSAYERIKLTIFDILHECDTMLELAEMLDEVFIEVFGSIMVDYDEDNCDNCDDCGGCPRYEC